MSKWVKLNILFLLIMLIGFVWLTIDVFDTIEPNSLQTAAIVTWVGLAGNAACIIIRRCKSKK